MRSGLRDQCFTLSFDQKFRYIGLRIIHVTEIHTFCRADRNTGRKFSILQAMITKSTFINIPVGMYIPCIIRAGYYTGAAADAFIFRNLYDAPLFIMAGTGGAASYARRIITLITAFRTDLEMQIRIDAVVDLPDPIAGISYRNIVFSLAGNNTVTATDTFPCINGHCKSHDFASFSLVNLNFIKFPRIPVPPMTGSTITLVIS